MKTRGSYTAGLIALCATFLLPSLVFAGGRVLLPSDGVLLDLHNEPPGGQGLYVGEVIGAGSPLQVGDLVLSVNGRSVDALLASPRFTNFGGRTGAEIGYLAERDSQRIELEHGLQRLNVLAGLRANWSSYLFLIYMLAMAVFVFARRPDLPAARGLLWAGTLVIASGLVFFLGLQPAELLRGWPTVAFVWAAIPLFGLAMGAAAHFMLLFPHRRAWLTGRRWLVPLIYLGPWLLWLPLVTAGWREAGSSSARLLLTLRLSGVFSIVYPLLIVLSLLHGYLREFDASRRRQTRWVLWGASVALLPWIALSVLPSLLGARPVLPQFVVGLIWLIIPTAFGIAIVRESLFDIDRIIKRTLVYTLLTVILTALYLAGVTLLQSLFRAISNQQSPLAIVISTLAIAALFSPLRQRVQTAVSRRFYRTDYDVAQTLNSFAESLRDEVDIERIQDSLMSVTQETMRPQSVSLWLRSA